jgi:hypothetical protein
MIWASTELKSESVTVIVTVTGAFVGTKTILTYEAVVGEDTVIRP